MRQILRWFLQQSRRRLRRHEDRAVQKFLTKAHSRLRRHVGRWSRSSRCMRTLWCLLVSAGVPRMRLCSSLSVVQHLICRLVFFFFNAELVFLRPCLLRRLVRPLYFKMILKINSKNRTYKVSTNIFFKKQRTFLRGFMKSLLLQLFNFETFETF